MRLFLRTVPFIVVLSACIGTKPFGFRKVERSTTRSYYGKGHLKEVVHTRRILVRDCPGCREFIFTRKKMYAEDGRLIYKEKMERRMYTARLIRLNSKKYDENGTLRESKWFRKGKGMESHYDQNGKFLDSIPITDFRPN
jgi:antitoxin component YwqK of YwqJK toxin-antitoxin module